MKSHLVAGWIASFAIALGVLSTPAVSSGLQDLAADQVIERYYEALGGRDRLEAVKTIVSKGRMSIPEAGVEGTFELVRQAPNRTRMVVEMEGVGKQCSGFNGEDGWEVSDMNGPRLLSEKELDQARAQASLFPLWNYQTAFDSVELTGKAEFAGQECHEITAKKEGLNPMRFYFSMDSGLLAGVKMKLLTQAGELDIAMEQNDYKEIDGIKVSMKGVARVEAFGFSQVLDTESVTFNSELAEGVFELPEEVRKLKNQAQPGG